MKEVTFYREGDNLYERVEQGGNIIYKRIFPLPTKKVAEPTVSRPSQKHAVWTPEDNQQLIELYLKGWTLPRIAKMMKRTVGGTTCQLTRLRSRGYNIPCRMEELSNCMKRRGAEIASRTVSLSPDAPVAP